MFDGARNECLLAKLHVSWIVSLDTRRTHFGDAIGEEKQSIAADYSNGPSTGPPVESRSVDPSA